MPDGELRIYCTRFATIISYFADDGEDGTKLVTEASDCCLLPKDAIDRLLSDTRQHILGAVALRLNCEPQHVELHSLKDLRKIVDRVDAPRHPWQVQRTRAVAKRFSR